MMTEDGTTKASWEQVLAWRMRRQQLLEPARPDDLTAVVGRLSGLHAQVMSSVELALWARVDGLTREAVHDALWRDRTLVKLWAMRGTLHVLPAADLGLWLAGLGTYEHGWPLYGLRDPFMRELATLVGRALHGTVLSRAELASAVERLSGSAPHTEAIHGSWGSSLKPASFLGHLCFGPSDGQRVRFTHPASWLDTPPQTTDADDALASIARRYLRAYGPATPAELGAWWGVSGTQASRMLALLGDAVSTVDVEGQPSWMLTEDLTDLVSTPTANSVRLLPGFDQWVVCASRRDGSGSRPGPGRPALDPAYRTRIYRKQGWVSPVLLVNGRMDGVWRHRRSGRRLYVEIEPFRTLPRQTGRMVEAEAERLADFLGGELKLTSAR